MDAPSTRATPLRVLIVDDEPLIRETMEFVLLDLGWSCLQAGNGREAAKLLAENPVDMVISDVRMPGGDGLELLAKIRENEESPVPVVLMSGLTSIAIWDTYDRGADAFLAKPFDVDRLLELIARLPQPPAERWSQRAPAAEPEVALSLAGRVPGVLSAVKFGRGGMFWEGAPAKARLGGVVVFELDVPGIGVVAGDGEIRWVRHGTDPALPAGCGVEFMHLRDECRPRIMTLISQMQTRAYIPRA
jgi:CheY-like chemotaxis protein